MYFLLLVPIFYLKCFASNRFNAAGYHPFDQTKVCRIYEEKSEIFIQTQDIFTLETSYPIAIAKSTRECPYIPQLCFKYDKYATIILKESCSNKSKINTGLFKEKHFILNYDIVRYYDGNLYFLRGYNLYECPLESLQNLNCIFYYSFNDTLQDLQIMKDSLIFMKNFTIYQMHQNKVSKIMDSPFDMLPFVQFENAASTLYVHVLIINVIIFIINVY